MTFDPDERTPRKRASFLAHALSEFLSTVPTARQAWATPPEVVAEKEMKAAKISDVMNAVDELRPEKAVFSDPGWALAGNPAVQAIGDFTPQAKLATREQIAEMNPRWATQDLDAELAALSVFDLRAVAGIGDVDYIPETPIVPSLIQVADPSWLVSPELGDELRARGFEVRVVPNTGHCINRDDLDGFMASLNGWI